MPKKDNKIDKFIKDHPHISGGLSTAIATGGGRLIFDAYQKGDIDGQEKYWHSTPKKNVDSIKKDGIKAPKNVEKSFTNAILDDVDSSKLKGKVYLAKNPLTAWGVGNTRDKTNWVGEESKILKVKAPRGKIKSVANPELRGLSKHQLGKFLNQKSNWDEPLKDYARGHMLYSEMGDKRTLTTDQTIDPKYIKGSDKYKKTSFKNVKKFIKNNPSTVAKGLAKSIAGLGLVGAGIYGTSKIHSKENKRYQAKKQIKKFKDKETFKKELGTLGTIAGGALGMGTASPLYKKTKKLISKPSVAKNISAKYLPTAALAAAGGVMGARGGSKIDFTEDQKKRAIESIKLKNNL